MGLSTGKGIRVYVGGMISCQIDEIDLNGKLSQSSPQPRRSAPMHQFTKWSTHGITASSDTIKIISYDYGISSKSRRHFQGCQVPSSQSVRADSKSFWWIGTLLLVHSYMHGKQIYDWNNTIYKWILILPSLLFSISGQRRTTRIPKRTFREYQWTARQNNEGSTW